MRTREITLKLAGDAIEASATVRAMGLLTKLAHAFDPSSSLRYTTLNVGSLVATLEVPDETATAIETALPTHTAACLSDWPEGALKALKQLAEMPGNEGVCGSSLAGVQLTPQLVKRLDDALAESCSHLSLGKITGLLYCYSSKGKSPTARVQDERGHTIYAILPGPEAQDDAKRLLDRHVSIYGLIERNSSSSRVRQIRVDRIVEAVPRVPLSRGRLLESIQQVQALVAETGGLDCDSVEAVRRVRYE